jgi:hypothetical protein
MSHFTTLKTRMVEKEPLVAAIRDLGYACREGRGTIRDFEGARTEVEIRIATPSPEFDIGLRQGPGGWEVIADWWGIGIDRDRFLARLHQRYAYRVARAKLEEQGFALAGEETVKDGRIHLVLRRVRGGFRP